MGQPGGGATHSGSLLPLIAVATAALLWAGAAAVARGLFDSGVAPIQLVEARAVLSALSLALIPAAWRRRSAHATTPGWLVGALGVSIALVNVAYYTAISRVPVAVAIVLQYLGPGIVVAWVAFARRARPPSAVIIAVSVAFAGVVLVSGLVGGPLERVDPIGLVAGLASALLFATYTVLSERAVGTYGPLGTVFRAFAAASALWVVYQLPRGWPDTLFEGGRLAEVVFVGLGGTLAPFLLYVWGVQRLRSERAVIAATLEPLFAALVAWMLLDQVLSPMQTIGGALILGAVVWLQLNARPEAPAARPPHPPPG